MEHKEDIIVLNNVTKFHKILIKSIRVREWMSIGTYIRKVRTDGWTGVTLNAPAIISRRGHNKIIFFNYFMSYLTHKKVSKPTHGIKNKMPTPNYGGHKYQSLLGWLIMLLSRSPKMRLNSI